MPSGSSGASGNNPTVSLETNSPAVRLPSRNVSDEPTDLRVRRGLATRDRLIDAARDLFGQHGYDGTSIEAILRAAGIQRGALYHHFDSKRAVFDAVLDRVIADLAAQVAAAARAAAPDPAASLRAG